MNKHIKFIVQSFIVLLISTNCVEHKISISINPNGSYGYTHHVEGDKKDITDYDYSLPISNYWEIENNFLDLTDSYYYSINKSFDKNELFPSSFYEYDSLKKEILLKHNLNVEYSNRLIYEYYNFEMIYEGRQANKKYPILSSFIKDQENASPGWVHDGLSYIFKKSLLESDFGFNLNNIISNSIEDWLSSVKSTYDDNFLQKNFENIKQEGIGIVESFLIDDSIDEFISLVNKYEKEARITVDLIDDIFEFFVVLPGILVETNADSILNDTLLWRFSGVKFADNDFKLIAKSTIYHKSRYHWTMIIVMLIITFTTIYWISSKVPDPMKMSK